VIAAQYLWFSRLRPTLHFADTPPGQTAFPGPVLNPCLHFTGDPAGQNNFLWFCLYLPIYELSIKPAKKNQLRSTVQFFISDPAMRLLSQSFSLYYSCKNKMVKL
jgi:hypothetical protein